MNRRSFISKSAITSVGFISLARCTYKSSVQENAEKVISLVKDPNNYLDLPEGFSYKVISKVGDKMSDGLSVPGRPDGMGTFLSNNNECIIIRNHENSPEPIENSPFGADNELLTEFPTEKIYDAGKLKKPGLGGTTNLLFDEEKQEVKEQFLSLAGTYRNCAGGPTPWNSWLTCEEDVTITNGDTIEKDHGFVFDVPANAKGLIDPKPILGMGRFNHEAVAVDPETGIIYQTEDRSDGLVYRFVPDDPFGDLHAGGKLQVLALKDKKQLDTRNWDSTQMAVNEKFSVEWIDIDDVLSLKDDLRYRGFDAGAARFARGEGMWYTEEQIYFACTNGGPKKFGQIFKYDIKEQSLELFAESEDKSVLHMCDNLTITPWGEVLVCEDNGEENRMHIIDKEGNLSLFAINKSSKSEFAGAVFSPSGKTLFVNIQENGDTLAVTGPWENLMA